MPATFSHCLLAREAITKLGKTALFPGVLRERNHFVVMGATGPDYPYLTDVIKYGALHIGHNWANRMHYENTNRFIRDGIKKLSLMDKKGDQFENCLAWFFGFVSHIIADAFIHPVVNCTVHGTYIFTQKEHGRCELVQDIYIFNTKTGTDICTAAARDGKTFGYLNILDDCSDPKDLNKVHPDVGSFWTELLKAAHSDAFEYFEDIDPDTWHKNYKDRVDFVANSQSIFRHVLEIAKAPRYVKWAEIAESERKKYIDAVALPNGTTSPYDQLFDKTSDRIATTWSALFTHIDKGTDPPATLIKDWNLDTGVDESTIDLWKEA